MSYVEYYADTMLWTAVVTFIVGWLFTIVVFWLWLRHGSRLAQVPCPRGGDALVEYREREGGRAEVSACPLRSDGRQCRHECAPAIERAAARLHS